MEKNNPLTRFLVLFGSVMVWFPILLPFLTSTSRSLQTGRFLVDYLMPAELFPTFFLGGLLLLWAAIRRRSQIKLVTIGLVAAVVFLVLSQVAAVLTGLASGAAEAEGWPWVLVMALLGASFLGMMITAIGGFRLLQELYWKPRLGAGR